MIAVLLVVCTDCRRNWRPEDHVGARVANSDENRCSRHLVLRGVRPPHPLSDVGAGVWSHGGKAATGRLRLTGRLRESMPLPRQELTLCVCVFAQPCRPPSVMPPILPQRGLPGALTSRRPRRYSMRPLAGPLPGCRRSFEAAPGEPTSDPRRWRPVSRWAGVLAHREPSVRAQRLPARMRGGRSLQLLLPARQIPLLHLPSEGRPRF